MQTTTLIITRNNQIYSKIGEKMNLQINGDIATSSLEENIIIALNSENPDAIEKIIENQIEIEKIIHLDIAKKYNEIEFTSGDVVIPNSVVQGEQAHFLEYAPSGDYDLEKFNLVLNGTIGPATGANNDEFEVDIVDDIIFPIASLLQKNDLLSKTVIIRGIGDDSIDNVMSIFELIV